MVRGGPTDDEEAERSRPALLNKTVSVDRFFAVAEEL
jgi:hypothetical protein